MKKLTIILTVLFMTITTGLMAQNLNTAGKAFNKGLELNKEGNLLEANESFAKCASICAELGEVGEGLKLNAETQICNNFMKMGVASFKEKKYDSALILFTESEKYATIIDDPTTNSKLGTYFAATYTGQGNALYKKTKFAKAVESYNKALEYNDKYPNAYYGLILGYKKLDDSGMLEESLTKLKECTSDEKLLTKGNLAAAGYFLKQSGKAIQEENYKVASMMAHRSISYNQQEPTAFYYLALASNATENWGNAQKSALKAISFEEEDQANYYFELGRAYEGLGDTEKACEAYASVSDGPNKQAATYQRVTVLKCN
jgi:tetratricopeptide (TPR) repeat protein